MKASDQNPRYREAKLLFELFDDFRGGIWVEGDWYVLGVGYNDPVKRYYGRVTRKEIEQARYRHSYPFKRMFRFRNPDCHYAELKKWMGRQQRANAA